MSQSSRAQRLANYWHGPFPWRPRPGYGTATAVGSYPANGYGLFDMGRQRLGVDHRLVRIAAPSEPDHPCCLPAIPADPEEGGSYDPQQPQFRIPRKVIKGGSFLCADKLLPALPARSPPTTDGRYRYEPHRLSLRATAPVIAGCAAGHLRHPRKART